MTNVQFQLILRRPKFDSNPESERDIVSYFEFLSSAVKAFQESILDPHVRKAAIFKLDGTLCTRELSWFRGAMEHYSG